MTSRFCYYPRRAALVITWTAAMAAGGCASLSEQECLSADWRTIGYEDGAAGRPAARLGEHRAACAEYAVTPDLDGYRAGRAEGLREYCRPERAYQLARAGNPYPSVCPPDPDGDLRTAFQAGKRIHDTQSSIRDLEHRLSQMHGELAGIQDTLAAHQKEVVRPDTSRQRRIELLTETWELAQRQGEIEDQIDELESRLNLRRAQLSRLESRDRY